MKADYVLIFEGRVLDVAGSVVVGRSAPSDVVVTGCNDVSRQHARFSVDAGGLYVEDLHSTNGTFVGSSRINAPRRLRVDEIVRIGSSVFRVDLASRNPGVPRWEAEQPSSLDRWDVPPRGVDGEPCISDASPASSGNVSGRTRTASIFGMLRRIAEDADTKSDAETVARVSGAHLEQLLSDVRTGQFNLSDVEHALVIATTLLRSSEAARWANYLIDLHGALSSNTERTEQNIKDCARERLSCQVLALIERPRRETGTPRAAHGGSR